MKNSEIAGIDTDVKQLDFSWKSIKFTADRITRRNFRRFCCSKLGKELIERSIDTSDEENSKDEVE